MQNTNIIMPLIISFYEDIVKNKGPSHITDLMILTIKSLIPSRDYEEVSIDYNRYWEEIKLWKYYRRGENASLLGVLGNINPNIYWNHIDDSAYFRIMPIILANTDYTAIKREVIKNILFFTGNIETLIEAILLSKLIYLLILGEKKIIQNLKEEVIQFSQMEFIDNHGDDFRIPIEKYIGNFPISFEKNKIYAINNLNLSNSQKFQNLRDSVNVILNNKDARTPIGKCLKGYVENKTMEYYPLNNYYIELGRYIYNLRKGKINLEALRIEKYNLPDIFQYDEGEVFYHSLLNRSKIIKKKKTDDKLITFVENKTGIYKFTKIT